MVLDLKKDGSDYIVNVSGRIDASTASEFSEEIAKYAEETNKLVMDFTNVDFISSMGLRALLSGHKLMETKGGKFEVINVLPEVMEVFKITGFTDILNVSE